jgi:hypothetical protein
MIAIICPRVPNAGKVCVCVLNKKERRKNMKGGYVGEYNGNILKSSYEYIFAKILEFKNISYKTEEYTYLLDNGSYYTPDFFIYENNELCEIVEIRGRRLNLEERKTSLRLLGQKIKNVKLTLLTEKDLKVLCKEIGLSYNNLKTYWRKNPKNKRNDSSGKANAMYGKKHIVDIRTIYRSFEADNRKDFLNKLKSI